MGLLRHRARTTDAGRIDDALVEVASSIEDPGLRAYFAMHRARFFFTLQLITSTLGRGPSKVLDVGFFPGHLAMALDRLGYEVTGVSSPGIPFGHSDVHLVDIESQPLPFPADRFDAVIFVETIEHLPHSPIFALREMLRVTKPEGSLVVTTPNLTRGSNRVRFLLGRSPMFPLDVYFDDAGRGGPLEHRHNREYTLGELDQVVSRSGWRVLDSGRFVAHAKWLANHANGHLARQALDAAKYAAQLAIPGCRDNLYLLGRKLPLD